MTEENCCVRVMHRRGINEEENNCAKCLDEWPCASVTVPLLRKFLESHRDMQFHDENACELCQEADKLANQ